MDLTPEKPLAGLLTPLFALRGQNDWGIGDVGALREMVDWAAAHQFGVLQLLPINETGNDNSPYNAISSVALEPTTIEITPEALPDLSAEDLAATAARIDLKALRSGAVSYPKVKALKWKLLGKAFENFSARSLRRNDRRARAFRAFVKEQAAWLESYALFRVLIDENGGSECWDAWPDVHRSYDDALAWLAGLKAGKRRGVEQWLRLVSYVQWIAWEQWKSVKDYAAQKGVALMGDIPFGVSYYSADVWALPEVFDHHWCGGAPPERILEADAFTTKWGQNWGVPLYHYETLRKQDFGWWRQRVRKVREIFHVFRIDHVLGFFRIYGFPWRPQLNAEFLPLTEDEARARTGGALPHFVEHDDDTPEHKAANQAQGEELLKVLLHECGDFRLIGEDLGAVPDYVRPCLQSLKIAGFKVPQWEELPDGTMIDGKKYERLSVATYATHDHEPLRAMWENWMSKIEAAEHGGKETWPARDKAWHEVRRIASWAGIQVPKIMPFSDQIHERLLLALFSTNSWMVICMITDIFATSQRFNVPGAVNESNWTQRLAKPISAWNADRALNMKLDRIREILRATGRI